MNKTTKDPQKEDDMKDKVAAKVVDFLEIKDVQSGKIILRQRGSKNER